jgi:transposase
LATVAPSAGKGRLPSDLRREGFPRAPNGRRRCLRDEAEWRPGHATPVAGHRGYHGRQIRRATGAHLLFLPSYSPDLNPIEQVFAKLKHLIRAAEPRDVEATWRKVGELLELFSKGECANYLKNSGYVSV